MRIDLLDVGKTKYGDCLLIRHDQRSILIDGAHPGDTAKIRSQLTSLLQHPPPFEVDLLVVTHCHLDHIGCLPALVAGGDLTAKVALVADEKLGWGRDTDGDGPTDAVTEPAARMLVAALQEEGYADLPPDELEQFLLEDVTLEEKYIDMLAELEAAGTRIVRYGRASASSLQQLENEFASFGLEILGPTQDHLVLCAASIASGSDAIVRSVATLNLGGSDDVAAVARAYQRLARPLADATGFSQDQFGVGAAKNDQSIVIKVEAGGWSALLAGDMQFAKAEVPDLDGEMEALRQKVEAAGPYDFVKLTHHSSYNAVDDSVLDELSATKLLAHTGGLNDAHHPDEGVLQLLESRHAQGQFTFARTDRNGIVTVKKSGSSLKMSGSKGQLNDFSVNLPPDEPETGPIERGRTALERRAPEVTVGRSEGGVGGATEMVEVRAWVPHRSTRVTLTIDVEPRGAQPKGTQEVAGGGASASSDLGTLRLGGGRTDFPKLLFVTCRPRLESNIGTTETASVLRALDQAPSVEVVDLPPEVNNAEDAAKVVRRRLAGSSFEGVVLLGGFDVVPSHELDVLDAASRRALEEAGLDGEDADGFVVWSDEIYGDVAGDFMPELPVSRIPDGRRFDVVSGALQAPRFRPAARFGVGNVHRPFATTVFDELPGRGGKFEISETYASGDVPRGVATGAVYYMLHGSARDAARFWGETAGGGAYEAFAVENVPEAAPGAVVFTGCCWGALSMSPPAARVRRDTQLRPRGPEASVAVAYLRAGALGFVGCTGSHYSPQKPPYDYFGKPMHDAFWAAIAAGLPPAPALFKAKVEYLRGYPHGRTDVFSAAIETKILRQYTCLGLGW